MFCRRCHAFLEETPAYRHCPRCGSSLSQMEARVSSQELGQQVRHRNRWHNYLVFMGGAALGNLLAQLLFAQALTVVVISMMSGCLTAHIIYRFHMPNFLAMLLYAVPLMLIAGPHFLIWIIHLCLGQVLALWRSQLMDLR